MSAFENIIPAAFLACVALTACNGDRDSYAHATPAGRVDTVTQPNNMPAPQPAPEAPVALQGKDSPATQPLGTMDAKKENTTMPEALHGNNHSSPSVGTSPLKKSSTFMPKSPKVIWV